MDLQDPFLSATLIVKNESRFLGGCLESLRGVADELIIVDTGSTDDTVDIAHSFGAKVFAGEWNGDFSAARNAAIAQARGEWLLYIDADERVRPYDMARLRRELSDPGLFCATVRFHHRTGATAYREYRLLRRRADVYFQGAIHETFLPSLFKAMAADGGRIGEVDFTLDHLGYDGDQSHKLQRNLAGLQTQIVETPERVYLWWHLGTVYRDLGRKEEAEQAWRKGAELARARGGRMAEDATCFIELAKLEVEHGADPIPLIEEGLSLRPENLMLRWLKARALMDKDPTQALAIFEDLAGRDPDTMVSETAYDRRMLGAGALGDMGYCAFRSGDYQAAARYYAQAEAREPDNPEYGLRKTVAESRARLASR